MKQSTVKHQLLFLAVMLPLSFLFSQRLAKYAIGINGGAFIYQGDLTPSVMGSFKTPAFVLGFDGSRFLTQTLSARLDLNFGQLKGDEAKYSSPEYRQQRAFAFRSSVTEVLLSAVYHPLGRERNLAPYLMGGAGMSFTNIQKDYSRFNPEYFATEPLVIQGLAADNLVALPKRIPVLPVGAGLQYTLSEKLSLHTEASYRIMSTDYLDGFSRSVNPSLKDHYFKYSLGLRLNLGGKSKYDCPEVN